MTSTIRRLGLLGLPALLLVAAGCSSGGTATGTMSVHLVDAPADFAEINLHILALEAHSNTTGWVTLSHPDITIDLLKLTGGVVETLADGVVLEAGKYTQFRLVLGPGQEDSAGIKISNLVVLKDGSVHDLTVPSGLQSGVKLVCHVDVQPDAHVDVFIDFDAPKSIFLHGTGLPEKFILRPVIRCNPGPGVTPPPPPPPPPPGGTGSISGTFTYLVAEFITPLPGALVTAQVLDATGTATIVGSDTTNDLGEYTLDLLPLGQTCYVVSQPLPFVLAPSSFEALASGGITLDATTSTGTWDAQFIEAAALGNIEGVINWTATGSGTDTVFARQVLEAGVGGPTHAFIVRTSLLTLAPAGATSETFAFGQMPVGDYSLTAVRDLGAGVAVVSPGVPVVVSEGATTTPTLVFP